MKITRLSHSFSIFSMACIFALSLVPAPSFSQSTKAVEKAAKDNDIDKLISLHDKASKNNKTTIQNQTAWYIQHMKDPLIIDALISVLNNEHYQLRMAAAIALGNMKDSRAVDQLIVGLNDEKVHYGSVVVALAATEDIRAVKALASRITRVDRSVGFTIEPRILYEMGPKVEGLLIEALNDKDSLVCGGAAIVLRDPKYTNAIEPLLTVLNDENAYVRKRALITLLAFKGSLSVETLISIALSDPDTEVKHIASTGLLKMKDPRAVEIYISLLNSDIADLPAKAATVLLELDTSRAVEYHLQALMIMMESETDTVRMKAAKMLLNVKDPIPDNIRQRAQKIIDEETYIEVFVLYDEFERKIFVSLDNIDENWSAEKKFEYHDFNSFLINRTVTIGSNSKDTLRITDYNQYGQRETYMYLCFDRKGNIIKDGLEPVLVDLFQAEQKMKSEISYKAFTKVKLFEIVKIYPCQNCAEKTNLENCIYVW